MLTTSTLYFPSDAQEDAVEEEEEEPSPAVGGSSRRRLRSRNAFIDSELGSGGGYGGDSYADLEDFIVVKKGRKY